MDGKSKQIQHEQEQQFNNLQFRLVSELASEKFDKGVNAHGNWHALVPLLVQLGT